MITLDDFNSDLHLVIDKDGYTAQPLTRPAGFALTWAGARATHGICKGKAYFEIEILENLPVDVDDSEDGNTHLVRVGWSIDSSSLQLGEDQWSFGYGGTGKFSNSNRFVDYGERFGRGDVIGAMLDLERQPATMSFTKNGVMLGVAKTLDSHRPGQRHKALFPHVLSKNCRFRVNFGQMECSFPPPDYCPFIGDVKDKVRGMRGPEKFSDCEIIMMIGLPGSGKSTWARNMYKNHPEKRYNILSTDQLIDKMRVSGLRRSHNFHERFEVLIDKATKCLNELLQIACKKKRNYILDQTNVFASARRKKMAHFSRFYKVATVIQPEEHELIKRAALRTATEGKVIPDDVVNHMKANYALPEKIDSLFSRIDYGELPREKCVPIVQRYNREGQQAGKPYPRSNRTNNETMASYGRHYVRARMRPEEDKEMDAGAVGSSPFGGSWGFWLKPASSMPTISQRQSGSQANRPSYRGGRGARGGYANGGRW